MRLTLNEKGVLKYLIENARISDAEIARRLKISLQAVRKIRMKLEKKKVIRGYYTKFDYSLLGLNVVAFVQLKITYDAWERFSQKEVEDWLLQQPNAIRLYRVPNGELSHLATYAFKDLEDLHRFFQLMQTKHGRDIEILKILPITNGNIIERKEVEIFNNILNDKYKRLEPLILKK